MSEVKKGEEEHYLECGDCGEMFDMRDLGEVAVHMHNGYVPKIERGKYLSQKVGSTEQHQNGKTINLN